jgi:hypothetical protein
MVFNESYVSLASLEDCLLILLFPKSLKILLLYLFNARVQALCTIRRFLNKILHYLLKKKIAFFTKIGKPKQIEQSSYYVRS